MTSPSNPSDAAAWDQEWENIHQREEWGRYPSEHLVRFVATTFGKSRAVNRGALRFLEIGCGQGAQVWYLAREGFSVFALDGSATAIDKARARLAREGLQATLVVADAARLDWPDAYFDLVIDMECLMGCRYEAARQILAECRRVLRPGGWLYSQTFTHRTHVGTDREEVERLTFRNVTGGQLARKRLIRLTAEEDIADLYSGFAKTSYDIAGYTSDERATLSEEWIIRCQR